MMMTGVDAMQDRVRDSEMLRNRQWTTSLAESTSREGVSGVPVVIAPGLGWETRHISLTNQPLSSLSPIPSLSQS